MGLAVALFHWREGVAHKQFSATSVVALAPAAFHADQQSDRQRNAEALEQLESFQEDFLYAAKPPTPAVTG